MDTTFTTWSGLISPVIRHMDIVDLLIWCSEKGIRGLQRNKPIGDIDLDRWIYPCLFLLYTTFIWAHTNVEADRYQNLQRGLASWRPRRADGVVPIRTGLRPWKNQCFHLSLKSGKASVLVQRQSRNRNSLFLWGESAPLSYEGLQLTGGGPPTLGRVSHPH